MKKQIRKLWDEMLDELAFFLVGVWVHRKYIGACLVLVPVVGFIYFWLYWAAGCVYTGRALPEWVYAGYDVILVLAALAVCFGVLWGILAAADAVRTRRDSRRLGYIRIAGDGSFYIEGEKR